MNLGFYSPLPPARTGVADYSAALLGAMCDGAPAGWRIAVNRGGDLNLYHLGNNGLHRDIYARALAEPGAVVLHDAVLHHFLLGTLGESEYVAEFVHNYGAWHAELAHRLWGGRAKSGVEAIYFEYPMLRRAVERAPLVIVHNRRAGELARRHGAAAVRVIPHLFEPAPAPPEYEIVRFRDRVGVRATDPLFGVFGHLRESKRVAAVLRAFARVRGEYPRAKLLLAGEFASSDLARSMAARTPGVIHTGYLEPREFLLHAAAVDACINLRWPSAGETSGIAIRLMGMGKCVLVTAGEETADFPEGAAIRIDAGPAEEEMLAAFLLWIAGDRGPAREIGLRAAEHIGEHHALPLVAGVYWQVVLEAAAVTATR